MKGENVALVEIGGSHDECLLSQFHALHEAGCHVYFVGTQDIWDRNPWFGEYTSEFYPVQLPGSAVGDFMKIRSLNSWFKEKKISKVILNTAQGGHIRNLCLTASRTTEFFGIIHTLRKFEGSFTQRLINRKIRKYFVLNDYFLDRIVAPKGIKVTSFYPLRFPHFKTTVNKPVGEKWVTVIGGVENRRKDLNGSVPLMKEVLDLNTRFIFLGKSDPLKQEVKDFVRELEAQGLKDRVLLFDHFVEAEVFDAYLRSSDLIWPMVHPDTPSADQYFKNQISGAMNVSFAYHIPMIVHKTYFADWSDLHYSFPYEFTGFHNSIAKAIENGPGMMQIMEEEERFDPEFQEKSYVQFIFDRQD